jgi:hypothetical protein
MIKDILTQNICRVSVMQTTLEQVSRNQQARIVQSVERRATCLMAVVYFTKKTWYLFSITQRPTQPPIQCVRGSFSGINAAGT